MRARLWFSIYLAMIGVLVASLLVVGGVARLGDRTEAPLPDYVQHAATVTIDDLEQDDPERGDLQSRLRARATELGMRLELFDADGRRIAATGRSGFLPCDDCGHGTWLMGRGGHGVRVRLDDGRWLVATVGHPDWQKGLGRAFFVIAIFAFTTALAAWPIARRITSRLESLRNRVDQWGDGDLSIRVPVEGADEVADLATRFNHAADRVESLVQAQRQLLANASHELRSPLARVRMALAFLEDEGADRARWVAEADREISHLDRLIDDLLVTTRLASSEAPLATERVDLLAIVAEEAARHDLEVGADGSAPVVGDPRMLRRVVRNLLENAVAHGAEPVRVSVLTVDGEALMRVDDAGTGLPDAPDALFRPFTRGPTVAAGTGLGLSIVRQVVDRHGGQVRLLPGPGGGTRAEVRLPSAPELPPAG